VDNQLYWGEPDWNLPGRLTGKKKKKEGVSDDEPPINRVENLANSGTR